MSTLTTQTPNESDTQDWPEMPSSPVLERFWEDAKRSIQPPPKTEIDERSRSTPTTVRYSYD
jgi:hypothetical protein